MPEICVRISELLAYLQIGSNAFAKSLGISSSRVSNVTTGRNKPDFDFLNAILENYRFVNSDWLMTGRGNWKRGEELSEKRAEIEPSKEVALREETVSVPLLDIKAAANSFSGSLAPDYPEVLDYLQLPSKFLPKGRKPYIIQVMNDSMHPTLYVDDYLVITRIAPEDYLTDIRDNRIYVIVGRDRGLNVKRVKNKLGEYGFIRCRSDNRYYPSYNIRADEILNVYEVHCKLSFNLRNEGEEVYNIVTDLRDRLEDMESQFYRSQNDLKK